MKSSYLLIILLFLQIFLLKAQTTNSQSYGKVTYERILNFDGNPKSTSFSLFFNPDFSVFYENRLESKEDATFKASSDDEFDLSFDVKFNVSRYIVLTDFEKDSIQSQESLFRHGKQRTYIVEEKIHKIKWDIKNEFKSINDFKVQKAIGDFRGRKFIAWFSKEIPVNYGPWKLNGLPGLILNVSDDRNEVMFYIKSISIPFVLDSAAKNDFQFNSIFERISLAEYVRLKEQQVEELKVLINSKLPRGALFEVTDFKSNAIEIEYEGTAKN